MRLLRFASTSSQGMRQLTSYCLQLWRCNPSGLTMIHSFDCQHGAVLSLAASGETIYAGCQDGHVKVLDVETRTLVRSIIVQEVGASIHNLVRGPHTCISECRHPLAIDHAI
jgi:hypothetical protein